VARPRKNLAEASGNPRSRYHVEAMARGLHVLSAFSVERSRLSLREIAETVGDSPSTVFRVVATLCDLGYLRQDGKNGHYSLAIQTVHLGYSALAALHLEELALPSLERLQQDTGESVFLGLLAGNEAVDVISLRGPGILLSLRPGQRFPLYCSPSGRVWLAFMPAKRSSALLDQFNFVPHAPHTLTSRELLDAEIAKTREQGYSLVNEELAPGLCGASAPIFDARENCIAAVTVAASTSRVSMERLESEIVPKIRSSAAGLTERVRWWDTSVDICNKVC
jgi:IclR family pca regulon transcriptional regulator